MFSAVCSTALFLVLSVIWTACVCGYDLHEQDAVCNNRGCYVIYFQQKTFLESWKSCKNKNGTLATIRNPEEATLIQQLFSGMEMRDRRIKVRIWIGLQRQQKQCSTTHPLRGFTWTTGDQDTEYTNWLQEDSSGSCSSRSCVIVSYSTAHTDTRNNFKWLDGSCSQPMDAFLCQYSYKGMCSTLKVEEGQPVLYHTPFNLLSSQLSHVPLGSEASLSCSDATVPNNMVTCILGENGKVIWSKVGPLCSTQLTQTSNWCEKDNGGCQHVCHNTGNYYYCACKIGYYLEEDRHSCSPHDPCQRARCESGCVPSSDGYSCTCPNGYVLAPDKHSCMDEDECQRDPCPQLCMNVPGTFECHCNEGYQLDETGDCTDIDECLDIPCEQKCENLPGSYVCQCHLGFTPLPEDRSRCQDTDECQISGTCQQMCVNYEGGFQCFCEEGYILHSDGNSCLPTQVFLEDTTTNIPRDTSVTDVSEDNWLLWSERDLLTDSNVLDPFNMKPGPRGFTDAPHKEITTVVTPDWITSERTPLTSSLSPALSESTENPLTNPFSFHEGDKWLQLNPTTTVTSEEYASQGEDLSTTTDFVEIFHGDNNRSPVVRRPLPESDATSLAPDLQTSLMLFPIYTPIFSTTPAQGLPKTNQEKDYTWLLVAVLVPLLIILVVLVIVGIVYFARCRVKPRSKNTTDCYYWISGSEDHRDANKSTNSQV